MLRPQPSGRRLRGNAAAAGLALAAAIVFHGCEGDRAVRRGPAPEPVTYAALAAEHNARVERLDGLTAGGVVELRWTDSRGGHFEQGNLDLWLSRPDRLSFRVEKFGEVLVWFGCDSSELWAFDLLNSDEKVLYRGPVDGTMPSRIGLPIGPRSLLDLSGLTSLPPAPADGGAAPAYDAARRAWVIETTGSGFRTRHYFDGASRFPIRIEILNPRGGLLMHSELREYVSVSQAGVAPIGLPKVPRLIDVFYAAAGGSYKIALSGPAVEAPPARVFDVDQLAAHLAPDRVERP
jgi:hypothetical protein